MIERALDQLHHVSHVRGVCAGDECRAAGDQFFHRIYRLIDRAGGIGLALKTDGGRGRSLFLRQAVDEVVHDEIGHVDVLASAVIKVVASDRETITVAAEEKHVEIGPGETNTRSERDCAAMNEVRAMAIDEIRKTRRTTDPCERNDLFVRSEEHTSELQSHS